jgi:hypothetical protein
MRTVFLLLVSTCAAVAFAVPAANAFTARQSGALNTNRAAS